MPSGIIIKGIGGFYYVSSEDGGVYECRARGIFRKEELTLLAGDRVLFSVTDPEHNKGSIEKICERNTVLERPAVANINQIIAVIAVKSPEPDLLLLDKLLVAAGKKDIGAVVCINKIDLDAQGKRKVLRKPYEAAGYKVVETSCKEENGIDELKSVLKGRISVLAGQSGVGKSTLLNRIMNTMVMETGGLSSKIERGRHTTRHVELIEFSDGGYIADTPGFSLFELSGVEYDELQHYFPEFARHIGNCRFIGCSHIHEPECGVKAALKSMDIDRGRYERYVELYTLLKLNDEMKYKKAVKKGKKNND